MGIVSQDSIQVIFLGKVRYPEYYFPQEDEEEDRVCFYHIVSSPYTDYRIGDEITIDGVRQEVYFVRHFEDEGELSEYLDENYPDINEI